MSDADLETVRRVRVMLGSFRTAIESAAKGTDSTQADEALTQLYNSLIDATEELDAAAADIPTDEEEAGGNYLAEIAAQQAAYRARAL